MSPVVRVIWVLITCICFQMPMLSNAAEGDASYPSHPIRLLVPFAPGGGTDIAARIFSAEMSKTLGQPIIIDNRGGAGGNLAVEFVARAAPDGYTILYGVSTVLTVNPSLYKTVEFNSSRDFEPITLLGSALIMLVVNPSVPANTLKEFVALAKQKPGTFSFATAGVGSPPHLAAEVLMKHVGIKLIHVPFKGGAPAAAATLAGETPVLFGSVPASMAYVKAGKLKAFATTGSRRSKVAPDVPTVSEAGFPGLDVTSWHALLAPARTPRATVNRLHAEALKVLDVPGVQQAMAGQGLEIESSSPEQLAARIKRESAMWADIIKDIGLHAE